MRSRLPKQKYELLKTARRVVEGQCDHLDSGSLENIKSALVEVRSHRIAKRALDRLSRLEFGLTAS
jgi:hypothetical protein